MFISSHGKIVTSQQVTRISSQLVTSEYITAIRRTLDKKRLHFVFQDVSLPKKQC